jgi:hypothetical protein
MTFRPTALERAFELARSGEHAGPPEIRERLKREGYDAKQIEGPMLMRQLRDICEAARLDPDAQRA